MEIQNTVYLNSIVKEIKKFASFRGEIYKVTFLAASERQRPHRESR